MRVVNNLFFQFVEQKTQVRGNGSDLTLLLLSDVNCVLSLLVKLEEWQNQLNLAIGKRRMQHIILYYNLYMS